MTTLFSATSLAVISSYLSTYNFNQTTKTPQTPQTQPKTQPKTKFLTSKEILRMLALTSILIVVIYYLIQLKLPVFTFFKYFYGFMFNWLLAYTITKIITNYTNYFDFGDLCGVLAVFLSYYWYNYNNWFYHDLLCFNMVVNQQREYKLGSFKNCCLLTICFVIYDVFMVFGSSYVFGSSVMIDVATMGKKDLNPLVFYFPTNNRLSLLGLGDIALPCLILSYARNFQNNTQYYWILGCIGYFIGFIMTELALYFSNGQPALLYLLPTITIILGIYSWKINQLQEFWNGTKVLENQKQLNDYP